MLPRIGLGGTNDFLTLQKPVVTTSQAQFDPSSVTIYIWTNKESVFLDKNANHGINTKILTIISVFVFNCQEVNSWVF